MNTPRTALTLLTLYALLAAPECGANDYASPKDEVAAAVTWYDAIQWPDVRGLPYMEFTLAATPDDISLRGGRSALRGFLISEDDQAYRAFCDGVTRRILKEPADGQAGLPAEARELGPTSAVEEEVADLRRPKPEDAPDPVPRPYMRSSWIPTYTHIFVLARCFARQGRTDLAGKLDKALAQALARRPTRSVSQEPDFRVAIEKWVFADLIMESIRDFGDPGVSRPQLMQEFERIDRGFPGADKLGFAKSVAEQLRIMIAEDEAHAKTARPLEAMSPEEKVPELIFRLRDENGLGSRSVREPAGSSGPTDSPACQLIHLGPAAVPALIAALSDSCLTRSVRANPDWHDLGSGRNPSTFIMTIGECSESILFYISGRHFGGNRWTPGLCRTADEIATTRSRAQQWWRDYQAKGEKQVLTEGVLRADEESLEQARHLVALDPDSAVKALAASIEVAKEVELRSDLIHELATVKIAAVTRVLRHEMKNNPHLGVRVVAAGELWQRGETDAVPAMIGEWAKWKPSIYVAPSDDDYDTGVLIDFLCTCGRTDAIKAVARRFPSLPVDEKFVIVRADSLVGNGNPESHRKPLPAEFVALYENLIVKALDDRTRLFRLSTGRDGISITDPRICDMAACALNDLWPDRYHFQWKRTCVDRDLEIAHLRNLWRSYRGLAPLPVAKPPSVDVTAVGVNAVAICQWAGGPPLPDAPISVDQPLTADEILETIHYLHHHVPRDCCGFSFSADRDSGQSGIVVEIEWIHGARPKSPSHEAWDSHALFDDRSYYGFLDALRDSSDPKVNAQPREILSQQLQRGINQPVSILCCWQWEKELLPSPSFPPLSPPPPEAPTAVPHEGK